MANKSIFITGAASGIGLATTKLLVADGWRVGLCDYNQASLRQTNSELGGNLSTYVADVRDYTSLKDSISDFSGKNGGKLDAIFNCAGILEMCEFKDTQIDRLKAIVDINIQGVINSTHAAIPYLSDDSKIINMSSISAVYGVPEEVVYSSSKFAVRGLTEGLNIELESDGIWVCDIMVAYVDTPMINSAKQKAKSVNILGVNVSPESVAKTVLKALHKKKVHWMVGNALGATPSFIVSLRRAVIKKMTGY